MTYSLTVQNGDLRLIGSEMSIVFGQEKLLQDLQLWLGETYGIDRFHPRMGSELQNWIGSIIGDHTNARVQQEVMRVLQNYERVQSLAFKESPSNFSLAQLLYSINEIKVAAQYDSVRAFISITNALGEAINTELDQGV